MDVLDRLLPRRLLLENEMAERLRMSPEEAEGNIPVQPNSVPTTVTSWLSVRGSLLGVVAVLIVTFPAFRLHLNLASAAFLDLLIVVIIALHEGFWSATVTSLLSVACLNYFFIPPVLSFVIADPQNWVALAAFEFTAVVVSRLSLNAHRQAQAAGLQRLDMERLYEVSRRILLLNPEQENLGLPIITLVRNVFLLERIVLFDAEDASFYSSGPSSRAIEESARDAFIQNTDRYDSQQQVWLRVLRVGAKPGGALAFQHGAMSPLLATALASLIAMAVERVHSIERESRFRAARDSEQLRTAVLDALAHDFKTPLTTIRAASSGLLEIAPLTGPQRELVTMIDDESDRLSRLTTRLLRAAKLESQEVKVRRQSLVVADVVSSVVKNMQSSLASHRLQVTYGDGIGSVSADPELCSAALTHLLDNAIKYSDPGSPIQVSVNGVPDEVVIAVKNAGPVIPVSERQRIFDRFYRSPAAQHGAPGSGLGLSVAKRFIEAQSGHIWLSSKEGDGTTFYFSLPVLKKGNA